MTDTKQELCITVDFSEKDLRYLLITAVDGGYGRSWARFSRYNPDRGLVKVVDVESGEAYLVSPETFLLGLQRAAAAKSDEGGWAFATFMKDRIGDGIIADALLQFSILGSVVYS